MNKKALITSLVLGTAVFVAIFLWLGPEQMLDHLLNMDPIYLLLALILQFLSILIVSMRWRWFLNATGYKTKKIDIFMLSLAGQAMNAITPASRWGGEPIKAYLLQKKHGIPASAGMASIIVEKIADIIAFAIISIAAILYGFFYFDVPGNIMLLMLLALFFTFSVLIALFYVSFIKKIRSEPIIRLIDRYNWITDRIPILGQYKHTIEESLNNYYTTIARIGSHKSTWVVGVLFSLGYWIIEVSRAYVIFLAFGITLNELPLAVIATAYIVSSLIGSFPLLPGDLGIVEATMILIYSTTSIPVQVGGLVTIIDRMFSYWLVIVIGLPLTWYIGTTSKSDKHGNKNGTSKRP
ncbi:flippase-like domain-containing protein [archaeon]|nr:flippase-like domain-containing protein [archaeon]